MATDPFSAIVEGERRALIAEQVIAGAPSYAAVGDIATVRDTPADALRSKHPVNIEALGDGSFVQVCPSLGYQSLWTHVANRQYRAAYAEFLRRYHPAVGSASIPATLHVDHLYNRKRARVFGLNYVRMVLLPASINTSHGAGYEKERTHGVGRFGRDRKVDTVMLMKLFGFRSPAEAGARAGEIQVFAKLLAPMLGASPKELEREVADLLQVAHF